MPENATLTAVMINSLTTLVGFGALMASPHQGLESLGRVLTFGMAFCLGIAVLMPGFLRWISGLLSTAEAKDEAEWETSLQRILNDVTASDDGMAESLPEENLVKPKKIRPRSTQHDQQPTDNLLSIPASPKVRPRKAA